MDRLAIKELKKINKRIDSISKSVKHEKKDYVGYFLVFAMASFCIIGLLYLSGGVTGFVTFSESVLKTETDSFSVDSSRTVDISTDLDNINSILLSGTVHGNGKVSVFLVRPERKYLAYYFDGNAENGINFSDMCYDTCHIENLGNKNTLEFQLDGTTIKIDEVKYIYGKIIDFDLEPRAATIDYTTEPATTLNLKITNNQNADYTVLLYVDGPLSGSFSWQGSLIHMTSADKEKIIPITVKLPSNLAKGSYTNKITARYVPPGSYDFVGESPVAESFVTVENR